MEPAVLLGFLALAALSIAFYFLPALIAAQRDHDAWIWIGIFNLVFGWTVIGWIGLLIWAISGSPATPPPAQTPAQVPDPERAPCPTCGELIPITATLCRFCNRDTGWQQ